MNEYVRKYCFTCGAVVLAVAGSTCASWVCALTGVGPTWIRIAQDLTVAFMILLAMEVEP